MLECVPFDAEGKKVVTRMDGVHPEMCMDITVYRLPAGRSLQLVEAGKEIAVLLLAGDVTFRWPSGTARASRSDVFSQPPACLHVCRHVPVGLTAIVDSEFLVQATDNERLFESRFYRPEDCRIETMGDTQWEGTAKRDVLTIFDYRNAPHSNMVIGEVITRAGRWSSYVPHSHPQPEVYYYRFARPQGFGACFIGDDVYKSVDGSAACIPGGKTHPQTAAPGYPMYYCWMIRHLPDNPWTTRDNDPAHAWLLEE